MEKLSYLIAGALTPQVVLGVVSLKEDGRRVVTRK